MFWQNCTARGSFLISGHHIQNIGLLSSGKLKFLLLTVVQIHLSNRRKEIFTILFPKHSSFWTTKKLTWFRYPIRLRWIHMHCFFSLPQCLDKQYSDSLKELSTHESTLKSHCCTQRSWSTTLGLPSFVFLRIVCLSALIFSSSSAKE